MRTPDLANAAWHRSSYSGQGGDCLEVACDVPGSVPVRDSKRPAGPALRFPPPGWVSFVRAIQRGELPVAD